MISPEAPLSRNGHLFLVAPAANNGNSLLTLVVQNDNVTSQGGYMEFTKAQDRSPHGDKSVVKNVTLPGWVIDALHRTSRFQNTNVDDFLANAISTRAEDGTLGCLSQEEQHRHQDFSPPRDVDKKLADAARRCGITETKVISNLLVTLLGPSVHFDRSRSAPTDKVR
jgi:hypothetical protein